ncbi:tRNA 5-methoxyuridine(34)/uridine 5-oxyacetic acid(34) synthase CmoB [Pokkaliibacter sp. CJK22405]|uniref:tRNA 5-methoxyuridine(34)/uridine 5-oxyacetic acid(34) synthase CmoB n=1 Tax=Pokkaliibacter sp. CJK22405 TaxID=3384615 RepID=UPI00398474BF
MNGWNYQDWFADTVAHMRRSGLERWAEELPPKLQALFADKPHGDLERWLNAWQTLPDVAAASVDCTQDTLSITGVLDDAARAAALQGLVGLRPWRKGPFDFFGHFVDTEWRSDWKWQRVAPHVDLKDKRVLDVGCGSGYHCWRMAGEGARDVFGIDPSMLFLFQFQAVKRYFPDAPVHYLPVRMEDVPANLGAFDRVFSMGVLYHRRDPLEHLLQLQGCLNKGGELILETLVVEGDEHQVLIPEDRYAMMRNVWFLPSTAMLERWLRRVGYVDVRTVDVCRTTVEEQRSTEWMSFNSLPDFLDPNDNTRTCEGYPGPIRATLIARKP